MKRILLIILAVIIILGLGAYLYLDNLLKARPISYETVPPISMKIDTNTTADYNENRNAYFGDLHIHTSWSFDAFIYNVRATPNDAYLFGRGKKIKHVTGDSIQLNRPLDFMAVTDHAEYMGIMMQMVDPNSPLSTLDIANRMNNPDAKISDKAFGEIGWSIATNQPIDYLLKKDIINNTWQKVIKAADDHYQPGKFTTFAAYEWTSSVAQYFARPQFAENQHRNIIFKGEKVSGIPFSSFNSQNPEDLWAWMDQQRTEGIELLAIPHNANISDGKMYGTTTFDGSPMDLNYVKQRIKNEPVCEVIQIKGQSMSHPALSPNDEFADFEIYEHTLGRVDPRKMANSKGSYVRDALKDGLVLEDELGENPYKFGFIGSTDGHNGASNHEEDNNVGKAGYQDIDPKARLENSPAGVRHQHSLVAGLAGVWAKENTREAIFEALQRKEVFATSGTRLKMRFFASWLNYSNQLFEQEDWLTEMYKNAAPMGSDLLPTSSPAVPTFIIQAIKDVEGANLDRVQVVKGWLDENGEPQEKIFDVIWSGNRQLTSDGKLPAVGNTVDANTATYSNDIGAVTLQTIWKDPEFEITKHAFYYLRILEIPTPRWSTYDAAKEGLTLPEGTPISIQERAWSSPIWYSPR